MNRFGLIFEQRPREFLTDYVQLICVLTTTDVRINVHMYMTCVHVRPLGLQCTCNLRRSLAFL